MMPANPKPKPAETVNKPISSWVNRNADMAAIWHADPASTVLRPPMRSETQPQNWRLTKAVPSNTDSISAPCEARMPRSLQNAGRCACGMAIGLQQKMQAAAINANTRLGGQPITALGDEMSSAEPIGSGHPGG